MREKVLKVLEKACPEIDFAESVHMVMDGTIDSISLVNIISMLSAELGIDIPYGEISPNNFDSLESIVSLTERMQQKKEDK